MSIELVMLSNCLILCHPLLLLPSIFPSIKVFSSKSALCIRWPKYWSFSFSINPSMNIQGWFPLGLTGLASLQFKGLSRVFSSTTIQKCQFFSALTLTSVQTAEAGWLVCRLHFLPLAWEVPVSGSRWDPKVRGCCWAVKDTGILYLQRRGIQSGASNKAWPLRAFVW